MTPLLRATAALIALAAPASAQDFSEGSEAKSWGLLGEAPARFEAEVVDILCQLSDDCPENCGAGDRQLGLLRSADGVLVLPMKNFQPVFTGAVADLAPYCGQIVELDGLLVGEAEVTPAPFYMIQRIRPEGAAEFLPATRFTEVWAERHPEAAAKGGEWFRNDPAIEAHIAAEGYLGLGPSVDEAFFAEWF